MRFKRFIYVPNEVEEEAKRMRVFVPYVNIEPATLISLLGLKYTAVKTLGEFDYWFYFKERWKETETFVNIEHDIVVYPGAVKAIWECPEPWCVYDLHLPCHWGRNLETEKVGLPLGCMKISKEIIQESREHWDGDPVSFERVDLHLTKLASKFPVHQHYPGVVNANPEFLKMVAHG